MNVEIGYSPTSEPWGFCAGADQALNVIDAAADTRSEPGVNVFVGAANEDRPFVEFKVGALDSPRGEIGIGYTFR